MDGKRVGRYEVKMYTDSATAVIVYHCNDSVTKEIQVHGEEDLHDLDHVLSVIRRAMT